MSFFLDFFIWLNLSFHGGYFHWFLRSLLILLILLFLLLLLLLFLLFLLLLLLLLERFRFLNICNQNISLYLLSFDFIFFWTNFFLGFSFHMLDLCFILKKKGQLIFQFLFVWVFLSNYFFQLSFRLSVLIFILSDPFFSGKLIFLIFSLDTLVLDVFFLRLEIKAPIWWFRWDFFNSLKLYHFFNYLFYLFLLFELLLSF
jgi:hypothetical protein